MTQICQASASSTVMLVGAVLLATIGTPMRRALPNISELMRPLVSRIRSRGVDAIKQRLTRHLVHSVVSADVFGADQQARCVAEYRRMHAAHGIV